MTTPTPSPRSRAGLVLPGLGHLLCGQPAHGTGLLILTGIVLWALVGVPRLVERIHLPQSPDFALHPWVAMVIFGLMVGGLWWKARVGHSGK